MHQELADKLGRNLVLAEGGVAHVKSLKIILPHERIDDVSKGTEVLHFLPLHHGDEVTHQHHVAEASSVQVTTQNVPKYLDGLIHGGIFCNG